MPRPMIKEKWYVQAFQHGCADRCDGGCSYETRAEAEAAALEWSSSIPYDDDTEHECVVFKAVATYRGIINPEKTNIR